MQTKITPNSLRTTITTGYKAVIMSDLHLGMKDCKPSKILEFLDSMRTDILILNGDVIDFDALRRGSKWKNKHTKVITKILDISRHIPVIYIRGNHDDDIREFFGMEIGNIQFTDEYIIENKEWVEDDVYNHRRYLVFHGDQIDVFTSKFKLLTQIGSMGYDLALRLNTIYNKYREWRKLPYHSISKSIKENFKKAWTFINNFEENAVQYGKRKSCDGVICGHIHIPAMKEINGMKYYNSGDWVENFTAIVITKDYKFELIQM
jgi:UDP-2,3-diacylglucosamine pyrophosphatase LpxH